MGRSAQTSDRHGANGLKDVSRAVAHLYLQLYGRGPRCTHASLGRDSLTVILEDVYSTEERALIRNGRFDLVEEMRHACAAEGERMLRETVEEITGRRVRAVLTQVSEDPEIAVEVFVFAPPDAVEPTEATEPAAP